MEQDRPDQKTNIARPEEQLDHQYQDPLNKANDSGMTNRGQTPEFTGEKQEKNQLERDTNARVKNNAEEEIKRRDQQRMKKMDIPEEDADQKTQHDDEVVDQDPGERQKENQNQKKDDELAA